MSDFQYRQDGFCVNPKSKSEICKYADVIRQLFFPVEHRVLDVVRLVEHEMPRAYENFRYEIVPDGELPDREAEFSPTEFCIRMRESIYMGACNHNGHCRFTLAHELGHFFMHRDQQLAFGRSAADGFVPYHRNSEWQADTFARALLAPVRLAKGMTADCIELMFEVSRSVAQIVHEEVVKVFGEDIRGLTTSQSTPEGFLPGIDWGAT